MCGFAHIHGYPVGITAAKATAHCVFQGLGFNRRLRDPKSIAVLMELNPHNLQRQMQQLTSDDNFQSGHQRYCGQQRDPLWRVSKDLGAIVCGLVSRKTKPLLSPRTRCHPSQHLALFRTTSSLSHYACMTSLSRHVASFRRRLLAECLLLCLYQQVHGLTEVKQL